MESYAERRLMDLHNAGVKSNWLGNSIAITVAILFIVLLPYLHIGVFYYIWSHDKPTVDRTRCSCDCFDTIFRGRYEWPPSSYKHVYFNCTRNTLLIWLVAALGIIALYESIRRIVSLIRTKNINLSMLALFVASIYPHYYGWWGLFSYLNEDYYPQWYHQWFFSITEALSTAVVLQLSDKRNVIQPWQLLVILCINMIHVIIGSLDQFIDNVIYRKGAQFEAVRDFGLMIPDVFHILVAYFELGALAGRRGVGVIRLFHREEIMTAALLVVLLSLLGKNL
jgi:magnesium-transporting ATPase (P-type)